MPPIVDPYQPGRSGPAHQLIACTAPESLSHGNGLSLDSGALTESRCGLVVGTVPQNICYT